MPGSFQLQKAVLVGKQTLTIERGLGWGISTRTLPPFQSRPTAHIHHDAESSLAHMWHRRPDQPERPEIHRLHLAAHFLFRELLNAGVIREPRNVGQDVDLLA